MSHQPNKELDPVERALRIGQLRAELAELTGKPVAEHTADSLLDDSIFIYDTNHLSDKALYRILIDEVLGSDIEDMPVGAGWNCRFSICEISDQDKNIPECHLRYYADEADRSYWAENWPEESIPSHKDPPYDRDDFLPDLR